MTEHLSTGIVERFERQVLGPGDRLLIYDHVMTCEKCRQRIVDSRGEGVILRALTDRLLPDDSEEPFHLEFDLIEGYVDQTLSPMDRDTAEMHLEVCPHCSAEVNDLRTSLTTMREASLRQSSPPSVSFRDRIHAFSFLPGLWYSLRVPAMVALLILMIASGLIMWRMRSSDRDALQNPRESDAKGALGQPSPAPIQAPSPSIAVTVPHPDGQLTVKGSQQTARQSLAKNGGGHGLVLNDGTNLVTLDQRNKLTGLEHLPNETRQQVKDVLLAGVIKKPAVLADVADTEAAVRGGSDGDNKIKLLYPGSTVVVEDRPVFRWLTKKDATGYEVRVGDEGFHEVAKSGALSPATTEWQPTIALKRGVLYTWIVKVHRDEVETNTSSPQPEMKFQVLDADKLAELQRLRTSRSHLALGIFYARVGMILEAEREFQILLSENPHHPIAKKLLRQVQSWQRR